MAALPTTATLSSGKVIDLTIAFLVMTPVDELGLDLDPAVRVAVAHLIGRQLLELGFVGLQERLAQCLNGLIDRGCVGFGARRGRADKLRCAERESAGNGQITAGYLHGFLPVLTPEGTSDRPLQLSGRDTFHRGTRRRGLRVEGAVDLFDRAAARLDTEKREDETRLAVPEGEKQQGRG
jgi:hypothetical protein